MTYENWLEYGLFMNTSDLKIVVLTLHKSKDRQARIKCLLDDATIPFEFFWGVDGREDFDPSLKMYDEQKRLKAKGQAMSPGQLGCFASHYNIWMSCVRENRNYVVIEDDVLLDKQRFSAFLQSLKSLPERIECLRLFENKTRNHKRYFIAKFGDFEILRYTKGPMSTMGYFLTPAAAKKFISSADPIFLPVDIYMDRYWVNGVVCLGVEPPFITHDSKFESIIGYKARSERRSLLIRFHRELFTLTERLRRYIFNARLSQFEKGKALESND